MEFRYSYGNERRIVRFATTTGTVYVLREIISEDLKLEFGSFMILDLGRMMSDDETLSTLQRNKFTIQKLKNR